jgi:hypothetical protein
MIYLEKNYLEISFPELHDNAGVSISFKRTLRLPDDGETHHLPPDLGEFPLRHIEDFDLTTHNHLKKRGGIIMPMFQADALWINFSPLNFTSDIIYPIAIKIGTGKICAVSGEDWSSTLNQDPQDYVVAPSQPWIDGYNVGKDKIRQFVATPLGEGYTAEEQLTGEASVGGIQIQAFPMKKEYYDEMEKEYYDEMKKKYYDEMNEVAPVQKSMINACAVEPLSNSPSMGLAPGGSMHQKIYEDVHGLDAWDHRKSERFFVTIANANQWMGITGEEPPISSYTAHEYTKAGLPWFDHYDGDKVAIAGAKRLKKIKTIKNIKPKTSKKLWKEDYDLPIIDPKVVSTNKRVVNAGEW